MLKSEKIAFVNANAILLATAPSASKVKSLSEKVLDGLMEEIKSNPLYSEVPSTETTTAVAEVPSTELTSMIKTLTKEGVEQEVEVINAELTSVKIVDGVRQFNFKIGQNGRHQSNSSALQHLYKVGAIKVGDILPLAIRDNYKTNVKGNIVWYNGISLLQSQFTILSEMREKEEEFQLKQAELFDELNLSNQERTEVVQELSGAKKAKALEALLALRK